MGKTEKPNPSNFSTVPKIIKHLEGLGEMNDIGLILLTLAREMSRTSANVRRIRDSSKRPAPKKPAV